MHGAAGRRVEKIKGKRKQHRHGRTDVEYLVIYAGQGQLQSEVWEPAKELRRHSTLNTLLLTLILALTRYSENCM